MHTKTLNSVWIELRPATFLFHSSYQKEWFNEPEFKTLLYNSKWSFDLLPLQEVWIAKAAPLKKKKNHEKIGLQSLRIATHKKIWM